MTVIATVHPVSDVSLMTKEELWKHILRFHNIRSTGLISKTLKERMLLWHQENHNAYDYTFEQPEDWDGHARLADGRKPVWTQFLHEHVAAEPSEEQAEVLDKIMAAQPVGKVLSASERKSLSELIDNDFASLRHKVQQFAEDSRRAATTTNTEEWATKTAAAAVWQSRAEAMTAKHRAELASLREKATDAGVSLRINAGNWEATVDGQQQALADTIKAIDASLVEAKNALERQRLTAQRTVLMSGVSVEGLALLDTIPSAEQLMVSAYADRAAARELTV